jgi:hypothetical protein
MLANLFAWRRATPAAPDPRVQRDQVLETLVREVFPKSPYYYDAAFSFLQARFQPQNPVRLDLFFPDYPLAVDILGPDLSLDYREAAPYLNPEHWRDAQARWAAKSQELARRSCPYLVIRHYEPVDPLHLRERVRVLLGRYPS